MTADKDKRLHSPDRTLVDVVNDSAANDDHDSLVVTFEVRSTEDESDTRLSVFTSDGAHGSLTGADYNELQTVLFAAFQQLFGWECGDGEPDESK